MRTVGLGRISPACCGLGLTVIVSSAFAGTPDAFVGNWDLDVVKSRFEPAPPMRKYTMKVIDAGAGHLLIKSDWIEADGTVGHVEYSTALDGKPVPLVDYAGADTVTDIMVNATTWKSVWTKHGKIVEWELETISEDGKTLREMDRGTDDRGRKYKNHLVFERP